jgi:hypothetical protein
MARARNICPPGILCITPSVILLVVILLVLVIYIYNEYKNKKQIIYNVEHPLEQQQQPIYINVSRG